MRLLVALLFLGACATSPLVSPGERVAGCWIDHHADGGATTMRWFADPERPGALRGAKLEMSPSGTSTSENYVLEERTESWTLCQLEAQGERCWQVAQGDSGSLEGGRAFIDTHGENLRISVMGQDGERMVFSGARDGCD